jgi:hypothetical protein
VSGEIVLYFGVTIYLCAQVVISPILPQPERDHQIDY